MEHEIKLRCNRFKANRNSYFFTRRVVKLWKPSQQVTEDVYDAKMFRNLLYELMGKKPISITKYKDSVSGS